MKSLTKRLQALVEDAVSAHHPDPTGVIRADGGLSEYGEGAADALNEVKKDILKGLARLVGSKL